MSRISLGGGRSVSIRDYATGLSRTGHPAGALRYAQGKEDTRKRGEKQLAERNEQRARLAAEAAQLRLAHAAHEPRVNGSVSDHSPLDNVGTPE